MSKKSMDDLSKEIKQKMEDILRKEGINPERASSALTGRAFTEFYVRDIAYYLDSITDETSIEEGLDCDGSGDIGIDFIYEKDVNDFWICQSKYVGKKSSLQGGAIDHFFNLSRRIFNKGTRSGANSHVRGLLPPINSNPSITFVLLTNGIASPANKSDFEDLRRKVSQDKNAENYEWRLVDLSEIKQNYKDVNSSIDGKSPTVTIPILDGKYIDLSKEIAQEGKDYHTIVTVIGGNELSNLRREHRNSLFNFNIRGFLGNKGKNKKMRETLEKNPELFYLYNNGISAICTDMEFIDSGKKVKCTDFSIINGAQTVCSIHGFDDPEKLKKVKVLIRITQAENIKKEKGLNKEIIEANNTQNNIKDADFRSNDEIQVILETLIKKGKHRYRIGKENGPILAYMRKRTAATERGTKPVSIEQMAKALYAFNIAFGDSPPEQNRSNGEDSSSSTPEDMYPSAKRLFDLSDDGYYQKLFTDEIDMEATERFVAIANIEAAERFTAIAILDFYLNDRINKDAKEHQDKDEEDDMVYRSKRHFLRAFGYILRNFYTHEQRKVIYKKIVSGNAFKDENFVPVLYKEVKQAILFAIRQESNNSDFNFLSWLRSFSKVKVLIRNLHFIKKDEKLPKI